MCIVREDLKITSSLFKCWVSNSVGTCKARRAQNPQNFTLGDLQPPSGDIKDFLGGTMVRQEHVTRN